MSLGRLMIPYWLIEESWGDKPCTAEWERFECDRASRSRDEGNPGFRWFRYHVNSNTTSRCEKGKR